MKINISNLRTYLECPTKAFYEHTLRRGPITKSLALELGSLWHSMMETRLKGDSIKAVEAGAQLAVACISESDLREKLDKGLTAILPAFREWQQPDDWKIIAVEKELEAPLGPDHTLQGRLDALVYWNGSYWHLQHKTVSASTPLALYYAYMERDWHECAYQYLAERNGYTPYAGTILNTVRKLSAKRMAENPKAALAIQYIPRDNRQVSKAIWDITTIAERIDDDNVSTTEDIIQNRSACMGRYGNSPCPYLQVCNNIISITDNSYFRDLEDRYATVPKDEDELPT